MKTIPLESLTGYGSRVRVICEKSGKDSDETKIEMDFSQSSFPNISIGIGTNKVFFSSYGSIEQREILEAFKSVVKMLEA